MNTFLPYPDFAESARVLDNKRLGKQRSEVLQIIGALRDPKSRWLGQPAVMMWKGYEDALVAYGIAICDEWIARKNKDTVREKLLAFTEGKVPDTYANPPWLGKENIHASHRAVLLGKMPEHYQKFGWTEDVREKVDWPIPGRGKRGKVR